MADHREHFLKLFAVLRGEPLPGTLNDSVQIRIADVVVVDILLSGAEMILPAVHRGLDLFHIALADQAADLISGIGGGNAHHPGKLGNGGLSHGHDALHAERLHRGQGRLPGSKALEHALVKMQFELGVDFLKHFFQQDERPPCDKLTQFLLVYHVLEEKINACRKIFSEQLFCRGPSAPG